MIVYLVADLFMNFLDCSSLILMVKCFFVLSGELFTALAMRTLALGLGIMLVIIKNRFVKCG